MSAMELRNFENQLAMLSYAEQLAIIEYLVKLMQHQQEEKEKTKRKDNVEKLFALMDECPINTHGQKWTREELHERR